MINFNEARVTSDGQSLIIDVSIDSASYFDNVYIESIYIDSQDTFMDGGPSNSFIYKWVDEDPLIVNGNVVPKRHLRLELKTEDIGALSLSHNLFYVYVVTGGDFTEDTPCELEQRVFTRVVLDYGPIYRDSIKYVKELTEDCKIPQNFIDRILKVNALELSIIAGHYTLANSYWRKFFASQNNKLKPKKCCSK